MRTAAASWAIKILFALLILSFVSFYGWRSAGQGEHHAHATLAVVNGREIQKNELMMEVRERIRVDIPEEQMNSLLGFLLNSAIDRVVQAQAAERMGLRASEDRVREEIEKAVFGDPSKFDFDRYKMIVRDYFRVTPAQFETYREELLLEERFKEIVQLPAFVTDEELRADFTTKNEKVTLAYIEVDPENPPAKGMTAPAPSETDLRSYFDSHKDRYREPETRTLEIASLSLVDLANPTDTDLQKTLTELFPDKNDAKATGARVRASHILLKTTPESEAAVEKRAEQLYQRLKAGADFSTMAAQESEDASRTEGGDLGYFGRTEMVPEFEQEAFRLKPGEISKPIKSQFGYHIIRTTNVIAEGPVTVDRLRPELVLRWQKKALSGSEDYGRLAKEADEILAGVKQRAEKSGSLKAAAGDSRVHVVETAFVNRDATLRDFPDSDRLLQKAWEVDINKVSEPIRGYISKTSFLVRAIESRAAKMPEFSAVRAKVAEDWTKERRMHAVESYTKSLLEKWKGSKESVALLAKKEGLVAHEIKDLTRAASPKIPDVGESASVFDDAFASSESSVLLPQVYSISGKRYLFGVTKRELPDMSKFEGQKAELRNSALEELRREREKRWSDWLTKQAKIERMIPTAS